MGALKGIILDADGKELALKVRFEARIVVDGTVEDSSVVVRELAAEVARVVSKNTWNMKNIAPGEFLSAEVDDFKPELDAYLVWLVEWTHEVHTGQSMWSETGIKPHIIEIGLVKEVDYEKARVRVKVGEFLTNWLPWITTRAGEDRSWFAPNVDEQIVIFSPLGELSLGVVLAGIYQQKYPAPESKKEVSSVVFKDGTKLSYNKENGHLEIDVVGDYCSGIPVHICMSGSEDVFVNSRSVCRRGDILTIGETLMQGSKTVFANGHGIGRVGDSVSCGFKVISGSENVFAS
ncbi:spike protein [Trichonephila clavata]|uniref:Spike protein n=1 Tax=Trichonephila clavata TaxID=2740835 RepID=A0A8X6L5Q5_TRICU|nr:spike protein [Trichonephila clavata]